MDSAREFRFTLHTAMLRSERVVRKMGMHKERLEFYIITAVGAYVDRCEMEHNVRGSAALYG